MSESVCACIATLTAADNVKNKVPLGIKVLYCVDSSKMLHLSSGDIC